MAKTPEQYLDILIELSKQKLDRLNELYQLTEKQMSSINEDTIDHLNDVLSEKQQIIDTIDKTDEEYQIYFSRLKSVLGVRSLDEIRTAEQGSLLNPDKLIILKTITHEILKLLSSLKELDEKINVTAKGVMDELRRKTSQVQTGRQAVAGYYKKPQQQGSYFFDKKIGK